VRHADDGCAAKEVLVAYKTVRDRHIVKGITA